MPDYAYLYDGTGFASADPPITLDRMPLGQVHHLVALPGPDGVRYGRIRFQRGAYGTTIQASPGIALLVREGTYLGFTAAPALPEP